MQDLSATAYSVLSLLVIISCACTCEHACTYTCTCIYTCIHVYVASTHRLVVSGGLEVHLVVSDVDTASEGSQEWIQVCDVVGWGHPCRETGRE